MNYELRIFSYSFIVGIIFTVSSCDFWIGGHEEELINGYYIGWWDVHANRSIYIKDSLNPDMGQIIISGCVYSVGFDNRYILAKSSDAENADFKMYYILDTKGYYHTNIDNNNLQTFFNEEKFKEAVANKGLEDIEFTKDYVSTP